MLPSFHLLTQVLRWSWPTKRACRMFPHLPGARTCTSPIESPDERTAYANGNARMHDTGGEIFSCGPRPSRCEYPNKRKKSLVKFRIIHNPFFVPPLVRHSVHLPGRGRAKAMPKSMISNCNGLSCLARDGNLCAPLTVQWVSLLLGRKLLAPRGAADDTRLCLPMGGGSEGGPFKQP